MRTQISVEIYGVTMEFEILRAIDVNQSSLKKLKFFYPLLNCEFSGNIVVVSLKWDYFCHHMCFPCTVIAVTELMPETDAAKPFN